ncbi:MAG: hypothetical protein DSY85_12475 [Marinomonas sp.]|nr:MAG: hypothetical protein DSY85_12475 [Marinomonas sp.]
MDEETDVRIRDMFIVMALKKSKEQKLARWLKQGLVDADRPAAISGTEVLSTGQRPMRPTKKQTKNKNETKLRDDPKSCS